MRVRFLRFLVVLWGVTSATLPGVLSVVHASDAAAAVTPVPSHVESEGSEGCPPSHADCALCSWHRWSGGLPACAPAPVPAGSAGIVAAASRQDLALPAGNRLGVNPRAPPAA